MRIGLALPSFDFSIPGERPLRWSTVVATARRAEDLGFDSVWVPDEAAMDPVIALSGLARLTRRVRLGTLVLCAPLRPTTVLAKALATLDLICEGRVIAGIGAGYDEPELRAAELAETIQVLKGMWSGERFSFDGAHVRAVNAYCRPRPAQRPGPPVWVGGRGERLLEVAARHGDGWNTAWTVTPDDYRRRAAILAAACERVGRDPASLTLSVGLYALVGEDRRDLARRFERLRDLAPPGLHGDPSLDQWRRGRLVGTVEEVKEQLQEWAGLGISTLVVGAGPVPFAVTSSEDVEMIASAATLEGDAEHRTA